MPAPVSAFSPARRSLTATRLAALVAVVAMVAAAPSPLADAVAAREIPSERSARLATLATSGPVVATTARAAAMAVEPGTEPMATVDGVELVVPALDIAAVGFHQGGDGNLPLEPSGSHVVMASRNRGTPATSAVDVAVGADRTVTAPATGTVTQVEDYRLYGKFADTLVTIVPDGADVAVRMMHVSNVTVEPGDRVEPGERIARARSLPVRSQVDRHHDGPAGPHVHVDVSAQ